MVYFGESAWIGLREALRKPVLEKKSITHPKKEKAATSDRPNKADQGREIRGMGFSLAGIRIRKWWEGENWPMVADPENPFGDLTRKEELRIAELLKRSAVIARQANGFYGAGRDGGSVGLGEALF